jgi:hypothetical protein
MKPRSTHGQTDIPALAVCALLFLLFSSPHPNPLWCVSYIHRCIRPHRSIHLSVPTIRLLSPYFSLQLICQHPLSSFSHESISTPSLISESVGSHFECRCTDPLNLLCHQKYWHVSILLTSFFFFFSPSSVSPQV